MKSGRRKPIKQRRPPAPAKARSRRAPAVATDIATKLRRERDEALAQQRATAEVLEIIASSPGRLELIFSAILERATKICGAKFGVMTLYEGEGTFRVVALHNAPLKLFKARQRQPVFNPPADNPLGQVAKTKRFHHAVDIRKEAAYLAGEANARILADDGGARSVVNVPLLKDGALVGVLGIYRKEVNPFTPRQIELAKNFAAQAVIAIENARLLNELRQRTGDLTESLERQTATSEVLRVISSSGGELDPVFRSILANAVRLCGAKFGTLWLREGRTDLYRSVAVHELPPALMEARHREPVLEFSKSTGIGRVVATQQVAHVHDMSQDPAYVARNPRAVMLVELGGARTVLFAPMLKDGDAIGVLTIYRQEVRPFGDKQIELVQNFAAQAVIAIENARLLNELRQRTGDLTESLEQQTVTAEILRVISSSLSDTQPAFNAIVQAGLMLFPGAAISIELPKDGEITAVAIAADDAAGIESWRKIFPFPLTREYMAGVAILDRRIVDMPDARQGSSAISTGRQNFLKSGYLAVTKVPMLRGDEAIGVLSVARPRPGALSEKQLAVLTTFAAQAVIAIENTRLLSELRQRTEDLAESLQQQTATADVLKVISRSTFDLPTVLKTLVESAAQLCDANKAQILRPTGEGSGYYSAASYGHTPAYDAHMRTLAFPPGKGSVVGRVQLLLKSVQIADVLADPEYTALETQRLGGFRTHLGVPLLREGSLVGVLIVSRTTVRPFEAKHVELIETFADQAVIAIENVRLFDEVQRRTEDLAESLQQQTATADVLKVISRSTFDLQTVLDTLLKSAAHLCDADQGTITQRKGDVFYRAVAHGFSSEFLEYVKNLPVEAARNTGTGRALVEGRIVHIPDVHTDPEFDWPEATRLGGFRTMIGVPMLREGVPVGVLTLTRADVRPFTEKQIELVATFADQAAIAIENVRLFDEIQDKSRQLEEASRHKSQFLANMSHELRTPLNAILGYTELILDNIYGDTPDRMRATLERVQRNGRHLLGLINDVLDLSKIEAGQLSLSIGDYSLRQIVQDVFGAVESLAKEKRIAFKVAMPDELPQGRGDERRLTQVLLNLVGNAIKFTDQGQVVIEASEAGGTFKVAVRDTGPGISAIDQGRIFEEFQQADNSITKTKGGTGLGLAIARRIMELHGGQLWVESEVGTGSTFIFTLPVQVEQQARQT